ncbi:hypothetical protein L3N51_00286 [Metallosphaera sp. J1]|uniref:hypothetical protein n=1 Tax=Metallosphaera javensis (ex Hofmann et al. 2022) TaxID=99938 RepID=UPI001EDF4331|nr:hypothetical protein [Metallosphaera javensis (ex Hofmann et al. 2022)]MCG3108010.1 hypothetical protein [Metallosphaera javensis (ex Hofmann et al. 2022)]
MWRKSDLLGLSALVPILSFIFQPMWILGIIMITVSFKSFDLNFRDSIYTAHFRKKTSLGLLLLSILEGITGFGAGPTTSNFISEVTFGLMSRGLSLELHLALITPLALLFVLHTVSGFGSILISKGIRNQTVYRYVIPAVWLGMYIVTVYLDLNYFIP